jgi:hypothetical protein
VANPRSCEDSNEKNNSKFDKYPKKQKLTIIVNQSRSLKLHWNSIDLYL